MLGHRGKFSYGYKDAIGDRPNVNELFSRLVTFNKELQIKGCWNTSYKYLKLDGAKLYKILALGEGEVVRHLCGNSCCINPIHLKMGSDVENAYDERPFRAFVIKYLQERLKEDYSDLPEDIAVLVVMARAARIIPEYEYKGMKAREDARREYSLVYARERAKKIDKSEEDKLRTILRNLRIDFKLDLCPKDILE
jgi:hypothetical protein